MNHITYRSNGAIQNHDFIEDFTENELSDAMWLLDELSGSAVKLLFHVRGLESCRRGVCCAKAKTLGKRMECSDRTIRRRFAELVESGLVVKVKRRCRTSERILTTLGQAVIAVIKAGGSLVVSAHLSAHKGVAEPSKINSPQKSSLCSGLASPPRTVDPHAYRVPNFAWCLSKDAWSSIADWLSTAASVSFARCKMAHRAFAGVVIQMHRSKEWPMFNRCMCNRGRPVSAECLVRLAIEDAIRCGKDFGTVETAMRYIVAVVLACVREFRLPGANSPTLRVRA